MSKEYIAYCCKTDWDYHFPDDWHGVDIYFSEKSIKAHRKCVEECGIVKVKVSFEEVVQERLSNKEIVKRAEERDKADE